MGRKVCVARVDSEVIGLQSAPNVARLVSQATVASGMHERYLKGTEITVGNDVTWKRIVSPGKGGKGKHDCSLGESEASGPENIFSWRIWFLCSFGNQCDDWEWNNCRKVTFTLDSGAAVSAAPKSLGDDCPRSHKTATGEPVRDEGSRVLLIATKRDCIVA